jgi:hypothetical protein
MNYGGSGFRVGVRGMSGRIRNRYLVKGMGRKYRASYFPLRNSPSFSDALLRIGGLPVVSKDGV